MLPAASWLNVFAGVAAIAVSRLLVLEIVYAFAVPLRIALVRLPLASSRTKCQRQGLHGIRLIGHLPGKRYEPDTLLSTNMLSAKIKSVFEKATAAGRHVGAVEDAAYIERASISMVPIHRHKCQRQCQSAIYQCQQQPPERLCCTVDAETHERRKSQWYQDA